MELLLFNVHSNNHKRVKVKLEEGIMLNTNKNMTCIKGLILIVASLVLFACGDSKVNDVQMVEVARGYLDQNKLREAAIELKNALQGNPDNAEARYLLGLINLDVGDTASAEKEFRRAITAGWPEEQARIGLARAMFNRKAFQKIFDEIEVKDSFSTSARADLYAIHALAQVGAGDIDQATKTLQKATELDPKSFHVMKTTIQLQATSGDIDSANESLKPALITYGDNQEILLLSGILAVKGKDNSSAATAFRKVIELDPDKLVTVYGKQARLSLARLEILQKNLEQAQATLKPLLKQNDKDPESNFVAGLLAFEQGKMNVAEEHLLKVLKVAPDHAMSQLLFGTVSYAQKKYEQAAYYISKYLVVKPDNLGARKLLARTYIALGQHEEANAALQTGLIKSSGEDAELLALVGLSQMQAGNTASGVEGLEKAVKAAPGNSSLKRELAKAYIAAGETANAIDQLNAIVAEGDDTKQAEALKISAYIQSEQYDRAIDVVLQMLQKSPEDPAVLSLAGNVFVASNDIAEARKHFNKALQLKPGYSPATMLLARLEELEGSFGKAENLYKKLVETNPDDIIPMMALARLAETQKQTDKMIDWLEKARKSAPRDIKSRKALAEYYIRTTQLEKAGNVVDEAIKIAPRDDALIVMQARLQMAGGEYTKALSSLRELVTRVPGSVFARAMLGEAYFKLEQYSDARRQLKIVLGEQPYYTPALVLMANMELQSGSYEQALQYAKKTQKVQPGLYMGYELSGDAFLGKKSYADAKASYEQAWERKQSASLAIKLSEVLTRSGMFDEATKPLLTWVSDYPDDANVLQFLGTAYLNMKQNEKAIGIFEKVLTIKSDNVVALNNLAWLYSLAGDSRALELAERAYQVSPDDSGVQDTYGWILVQQGQVGKGRRILKKVFKALPDVPEVQYHYASALIKSGEDEEARKILTGLLQSGVSFEGRDVAEQIMK